MATDKPKVSGYVPSVLKERLKEFCTEKGGISESQALTLVLSEYFGVGLEIKSVDAAIGGVTLQAFQEMQGSLSALLERVVALESSTSGTSRSVSCVEKVEEPASEVKTPPLTKKLTPRSGRALAKRLNCNPSTITSNCRKGKSHFLEWSAGKDPDLVGWWRDSSDDDFEPVDYSRSTFNTLSFPIS